MDTARDLSRYQWENIAVSDKFREATPEEKAEMRALWMRDIAPAIHGNALQNQDYYRAVSQQVYTYNLPRKLPDEDSILSPGVMNHNTFGYIEDNPLYARKSYQEQQTLKSIWFAKMQQADPEFAQLPYEDKIEYYNNLIRRGPTGTSFLLSGFEPENAEENLARMSNAQKGLLRFSSNLVHSFSDAFGSLVLAPLRLLSPDNSAMESFFLDMEKEREWINTVTEEQRNFFTNAVPNFVGYGAGLMIGPFHGLEDLFSGTASIVGKGAAKTLKLTPGMLSKAGTAIGVKGVPEIAYQVGGGAVIGLVQGVSEAIVQGKPWDTYLARDATIGVGMEFLGRYASMARSLRNIARSKGIKPKNLGRYVSEFGRKEVLSPELETILKASPQSKTLLQYMHMVDENGLLLNAKYTTEGVRLQSEIIGVKSDISDKEIRFSTKNGDVVFDNPNEAVRLDEAVRWLDTSPEASEAWEKSLANKKVQEAVAMSENIAMDVGFRVPEAARKRIWKSYEKAYRDLTGAPPPKVGAVPEQRVSINSTSELKRGDKISVSGFYGKNEKTIDTKVLSTKEGSGVQIQWGKTVATITGDGKISTFTGTKPRTVLSNTTVQKIIPAVKGVEGASHFDTSFLDDIYTYIVGSSGTKKADEKMAEGLWKKGIAFSSEKESHIAEFMNLAKDVRELRTEASYIIMSGGKSIPANVDDIPVVLATHPDVKNPFKVNQTYVGAPSQIRQVLRNIKKQYTNSKRSFTRVAKGHNVEILKYYDTQMVEVKAQIPITRKNGSVIMKDATISFKSVKEAQKFMSGVVDNKLETVIKSIVDDDPELKEVFKQFSKPRSAKNPFGLPRSTIESQYMPYILAKGMAKSNGFYLGNYKGKYVLQSFLDEGELKVNSFDNLEGVFDFLKENNVVHTLPEMNRGLSQSAAELLIPNHMGDPLKELPYEEIKSKRRFGVTMLPSYFMAPPQHLLRDFEHLKSVGKLRKKFGFSPVRIHNQLRDMTMAKNAFQSNMDIRLKKIKGGHTKKAESEMISRWLEAVTDESEIPSRVKSPLKEMNDIVFAKKADVEKEMVEQFGSVRAQQLKEKAVQLSHYYKELFNLSGMDWSIYVKYYHPHMADKLKRMNINLSTRIDPKKFVEIPNADKEYFFELLREADPRDLLWERDAFRVAETYTHLMARKLYVRPTIKNIGNTLREVMADMNKKGITHSDYTNVVHYFTKMLQNIEGIKAPADEIVRYATDTTFDTICEAVNRRFGTSFKMHKKHDPLSKFITIATGAHLAARPFPVMRNLTQSAVTGGTVIGMRWWLEGLDAVVNNPGQIKRLMNLGMISPRDIPAGAGFDIANRGLGALVHKGMIPYKWADFVNRAVVFSGLERRFDEAFKKYMTGKKPNIKKFVRYSGMNLFGKAEYNGMVELVNANNMNTSLGYKAVKSRLARLGADYTQYLYNSFDQPYALREGIGKVFGQYTSWPINFYNLVKDRLLSDSLTVQQRAGFFARLGFVTGAIATGLHSAGISPQGFAPWNMMLISGGPYYQLLHDALASANGDQQAYRKLVHGLSSLVPFVYEGEGILKAIQAFQDGQFHEGFLYLASAPVRMDVYPRREVATDRLEKKLLDAGAKFFSSTKNVDLIQNTKDKLGVGFGL